MPHYTVHQTKAAIKTVIAACAPEAVVFDWWKLEEDHKKWPVALKSSLDLDSNSRARTHGYVIELISADPTSLQRLGGSYTEHWTFKVVGLHYYLDHATDHSSKLFLDECFKISKVFNRDPAAVMTLPGALNLIDSWKWRHYVGPLGSETLHAMFGELELRPC